jgi:hypothetical protein
VLRRFGASEREQSALLAAGLIIERERSDGVGGGARQWWQLVAAIAITTASAIA